VLEECLFESDVVIVEVRHVSQELPGICVCVQVYERATALDQFLAE
jgi:hypothetical protein